jgi:hypothetical protein
MDPITLHFNVFQAGTPVRKSHQVEDPRGTTISALKQELFSDEIKASKSVRFIAAGKILNDATALEHYKLGKEAHIHVSISEGAQTALASQGASTTTATEEVKTSGESTSPNEAGVSMVGWAILAGVAVFAGTGAMLYLAFQKRRQYTMHTSQLLFICMAIWVYLIFFHGLPALFQALNKLGNTPAQKDVTATRSMSIPSPTAGTGLGNEVAGATSSSTASPAPPSSSPGLSVMPTLAPGDATAASVLTQRH